jgi:hypothetical protein
MEDRHLNQSATSRPGQMNTHLPTSRRSGNTEVKLVVALITVSIGLLVWEWRHAHASIHRPAPSGVAREALVH